MNSIIKQAAVLFLLMTLLTGVLYPALITGIAQIAFPRQANGSLIMEGKSIKGSRLIGQPFSNPRYFWGRLSTTSPFPYNSAASSGSNEGALNPNLKQRSQERVNALKQSYTENNRPIPVDLITASASGLDPHITPAAAYYQVPRVAKARRIKEEKVKQLVDRLIENRQFGFLGEPRVNTLLLNQELDRLN